MIQLYFRFLLLSKNVSIPVQCCYAMYSILFKTLENFNFWLPEFRINNRIFESYTSSENCITFSKRACLLQHPAWTLRSSKATRSSVFGVCPKLLETTTTSQFCPGGSCTVYGVPWLLAGNVLQSVSGAASWPTACLQTCRTTPGVCQYLKKARVKSFIERFFIIFELIRNCKHKIKLNCTYFFLLIKPQCDVRCLICAVNRTGIELRCWICRSFWSSNRCQILATLKSCIKDCASYATHW